MGSYDTDTLREKIVRLKSESGKISQEATFTLRHAKGLNDDQIQLELEKAVDNAEAAQLKAKEALRIAQELFEFVSSKQNEDDYDDFVETVKTRFNDLKTETEKTLVEIQQDAKIIFDSAKNDLAELASLPKSLAERALSEFKTKLKISVPDLSEKVEKA